MNRSTPALLVHHQLPEFTQTHAHRVRDAIQPSHPLSSPSRPALADIILPSGVTVLTISDHPGCPNAFAVRTAEDRGHS